MKNAFLYPPERLRTGTYEHTETRFRSQEDTKERDQVTNDIHRSDCSFGLLSLSISQQGQSSVKCVMVASNKLATPQKNQQIIWQPLLRVGIIPACKPSPGAASNGSINGSRAGMGSDWDNPSSPTELN